jgi:hypothetical protein
MQFLIIAHDGEDKDAIERRLAARDTHVALGDEAIKKGEQLMGVALLNEDEQMCGSALIVDFPSREALNEWLEKEPYVTGDVWKKIEIYPCKVGPSFTTK